MKPEVLKKRFNSFVLFLHNPCWKFSAAADNAEKHYNADKNADFLTEAKKFSRANAFFVWILDSNNTADLENTVRLILIFSHRSAWNIIRIFHKKQLYCPICQQKPFLLKELCIKLCKKQVIQLKWASPWKLVKNSHRTYAHAQEEKKQSDAQKHVVQKRKATVDLQNAVANKKIVVEELKYKINCMISKFMHCTKSFRKLIFLISMMKRFNMNLIEFHSVILSSPYKFCLHSICILYPYITSLTSQGMLSLFHFEFYCLVKLK